MYVLAVRTCCAIGRGVLTISLRLPFGARIVCVLVVLQFHAAPPFARRASFACTFAAFPDLRGSNFWVNTTRPASPCICSVVVLPAEELANQMRRAVHSVFGNVSPGVILRVGIYVLCLCC